MQDLVEDDPLQLHVIPQIVLTGDTVRSVFANCSMLPGTMPRCNYESLHIHIIYIYIYIYIYHAVESAKWVIAVGTTVTANVLVEDYQRPTHLMHGFKKSVESGTTTTRALPVFQTLVHAELAENVTMIFQFLMDMSGRILQCINQHSRYTNITVVQFKAPRGMSLH